MDNKVSMTVEQFNDLNTFLRKASPSVFFSLNKRDATWSAVTVKQLRFFFDIICEAAKILEDIKNNHSEEIINELIQ
jgi:hypothetical protein